VLSTWCTYALKKRRASVNALALVAGGFSLAQSNSASVRSEKGSPIGFSWPSAQEKTVVPLVTGFTRPVDIPVEPTPMLKQPCDQTLQHALRASRCKRRSIMLRVNQVVTILGSKHPSTNCGTRDSTPEQASSCRPKSSRSGCPLVSLGDLLGKAGKFSSGGYKFVKRMLRAGPETLASAKRFRLARRSCRFST